MEYTAEEKQRIFYWIKEYYYRYGNFNEIKSVFENDFDDFVVEKGFSPKLTQEDLLDFIQSFEFVMANSMPAILSDGKPLNSYTPKNDPESAWQHYIQSLSFDKASLDRIEQSTIRIINHLSNDTTNRAAIDSIKGIVIGNVQSGKTANMEALISMSADYGWNFFIILSGTIENLRQQTESRMIKDLQKTQGPIEWRLINSRDFEATPIDKLEIGPGKQNRYFTVCLKNSTRLTNLVKWLHNSVSVIRQLKIIVIDDECDQAGVNTADISQDEKTAIYNMLTNLVNQCNENGEPTQKFGAMNYIGYSATPYANVLNDPSCKSLFPKNFIETLPVSPKYFGPQQIFGYEDEDLHFKGLSIVNEITKEDLLKIKTVHKTGDYKYIPDSLENAITWFIDSLACMRVKKIKKPFSLLIHTSAMTKDHGNLAAAVKSWFDNNSTTQIITKCKRIWETQTAQFNYQLLKQQYGIFEDSENTMKNYPSFELIEKEILSILGDEKDEHKYENIELMEINPEDIKQRKKFSTKIHICIDNYRNNHPNDPNIHIRLAYPSKENKDEIPACATGFIVIGGATLSRGLTIEGLVSSFFLRTVKLADTLMQMGRWFGYRNGYELLPRIWLTQETRKQFDYLSNMDQKLRNLIKTMQGSNNSPYDYRVKIIKPKDDISMEPTSRNKRQALLLKRDYTGRYPQTWKFSNKPDVLQANLDILKSFLMKLGDPKDSIKNGYCKIWRNCSSVEVLDFLNKYHVHESLYEVRSMINWLNEDTVKNKFNEWNVILAGNQTPSRQLGVFEASGLKINKVNRSQKKTDESDDVIDIGVLVNRNDFLMDIDFEKNKNLLQRVEKAKSSEVKLIRSLSTEKYIPQIVIYVISSESVPGGSEKGERIPINSHGKDIVGISINIPEQEQKANPDSLDDSDCYEIDFGFFGINEKTDYQGE